MGDLDQPLSAGESQPLDRAWYNELVSTLKDLMHASEVQVEASTHRVEVHHADDSLVPGEVALSDVTAWGKPAADRLSVDWTISSGPGHLEDPNSTSSGASITTGAGSAVLWTWDSAAWDATVDGSKLPAEVTVQAQVTDTEEGTTLSSTDVSFIVGRSYDPSAHPGIAPHVESARDVAYLSGDGTVNVDFEDYTDYGDRTTVYRDVTAKLKGGDGSNATVSGDLTGGKNTDRSDDGNVTANTDLGFSVAAQAPGVLVVDVEYEDGNGNVTTTSRAMRVRPSLDLGEEATADPTLPAVSVDPRDGEVVFSVGKEASPSSVEESGPVFETGGPVWAKGRAEALARRLGVEDLEAEDPQLSLLQQAGSLLVSALAHPTDAGLMEYSVGGLPQEAQPGQVLIFEGGVLRLEEKSGGGWTAIGHLEDGADKTSAHLTGNGAIFTIEAELAYGQASSESFPSSVKTRYLHARPGETSTALSIPEASPSEAGDRWHVRYRVESEWTGSRSVTGSWSSWMEAETVPGGPAEVELQDDGALKVSAPGHARGLLDWNESGESPISDSDVFDAERLPERIPTQPPTKYWDTPNNPPHLHAKLIQTAASGSTRDQVERFSLSYPTEAADALPQTELPEGSNAIPGDWDVVPGMIITGDTRSWIGGQDEYINLSGGAQMLDKIELEYNDQLLEASKAGPTEFEHAVPFFSIDTALVVHLHTAGVVDDVKLFDGDHTLLRKLDSTPAFNENNGTWEQRFTVPSSAYGLENKLLYQFSGGTSEEQLVELTLENSSVSTDDGPDLLTADPLVSGNPEMSRTVTRNSSSPNVWEFELMESGADWEGAYITLTAESLSEASVLSAADGSGSVGTDNITLDVRSDTTPQRAFLELNDSAFADKDVTISLQMEGNGSTTDVDLKFIQYSA